MDQVTGFLTEQVHLQTAAEQSGISQATEGRRFLGDAVRTATGNRWRKVPRRDRAYPTLRRTVAKDGPLHVPREKVRSVWQRQGSGDLGRLRPLHTPEWLLRRDVEIMHAYNAALRGFATYDSLATDGKQTLHRLESLGQGSLLKTLANKHQTTVGTMRKQRTQGRDDVYHYRVTGRKRQRGAKPWCCAMSVLGCCIAARYRTGDTAGLSGEPDSVKMESSVREGGDGCSWRQGITLPTSLYQGQRPVALSVSGGGQTRPDQ
jgi:Type II intron maturase